MWSKIWKWGVVSVLVCLATLSVIPLVRMDKYPRTQVVQKHSDMSDAFFYFAVALYIATNVKTGNE